MNPLRQISLGTVGLTIGSILTVIGTGAYFADLATLNLAGFFYGIPLLLGGLALKAAELKPVQVTPPPPPEVLALREQQATATQTQVRLDVTRYRYGPSFHLEEALERLGLAGDPETRPRLRALREENDQGAYTLILVFHVPNTPLAQWQAKCPKMTSFFGPGLRVTVQSPEDEVLELSLTVQSPQRPAGP